MIRPDFADALFVQSAAAFGHTRADFLVLDGGLAVCRLLGGDEFAVITTAPEDPAALEAMGDRFIQAVCAPYVIQGHNIVIGASVGVAVIGREAGGAADILRYADMALSRAKNEGRGAIASD